ncbi:MAG: hypothetical protein LBG76_03370 [Treponema sp.]|jgi:hypothetical protein|nr:hypothetical protein [Treponema sp.]
MVDLSEYQKQLSEALNNRRDWLERTELPKLKDEFRTFHTAFYSLYAQLLKRKLIKEDPYKQEAKIVDIEVPEIGPFNETDRQEQLSLRLSHFDNQLDFLVNFYQFSLEYMGLDKIKRILGLVKYVDWVRFSPDANATPNTRALVELMNQTKNGADQLSMTLISDALLNLSKSTGSIMGYLKEVTDFNRESYKLDLRTKTTSGMALPEAAQLAQIKKKFAAAAPGKPFYPDLAEEVIREDYSKSGPALREKVLKLLAMPEVKPKVTKTAIPFKAILIDGLYAAGSVGAILEEIIPKLEENHNLMQNRQAGIWEKLKKVLWQMMNKEPDPVIYEVEYIDSNKGVPLREKVNYNRFQEELEKKSKTLSNITPRSGAVAKMEAMAETQLESILERYIREIQGLHKLLSALDDFFKSAVDQLDRSKVKGIKPELATIKNAMIKANQKRYEYTAQREEEEQLRRLGITTNG